MYPSPNSMVDWKCCVDRCARAAPLQKGAVDFSGRLVACRLLLRCQATLGSMFSSPRACFFLFLAGVLARSPPLVSLRNQGLIVGREVTVTRFQKSASFLGIPFAASPVDSLRFAPPKTKPLPSWDITYNGTYFRPACLQTEELWQETHPLFEVIGMEMPEFDEDCLYLNVFVPECKFN